MNQGLLELLKQRLKAQSTEELTRFWVENDRNTFSPETFEAARRVLIERGVEAPEQGAVPTMSSTRRTDLQDADYWGRLLNIVLYVGGLFGVLTLSSLGIHLAAMYQENNVLGNAVDISLREKVWISFRVVTLIALFVGIFLGLRRTPAAIGWLWLYCITQMLHLAISGGMRLYYTLRYPAGDWSQWAAVLNDVQRALIEIAYPALLAYLLTRPPIRELFLPALRAFEPYMLSPVDVKTEQVS